MITDKQVNAIVTQGNREFSEVVTNLTKGIIDTQTMLPNYEWVLASKFPLISVFDGVKDFNYVEYKTKNDNINPYADITDITQLNSITNAVVRETASADTQSNVSTKILRQEIMNFKTNPQDALGSAFKTTINITKTQDLKREHMMWHEIPSIGYKINVNGLPVVSTDGSDSISKKLFDTMLKIQTTSKKHPFIGTDGIIEVTDKEGHKSTVQPSYRFNSTDFHLVVNPSYQTSVTFDGNRAFFNWGKNQMEFASGSVIDFPMYEGIDAADVAEYATFEVIAIHKEVFQNLVNWQESTMINLGQLYQVMKNFMKIGLYNRKDAPVFIFDSGGLTSNPTDGKK